MGDDCVIIYTFYELLIASPGRVQGRAAKGLPEKLLVFFRKGAKKWPWRAFQACYDLF